MRIVRLTLLGVFCAAASMAQSSAYLHGTILDPAGAVLAGIPVQVTSDSSRCETTSNQRGEFICSLPPGTYTITTKPIGFFPYKRAPIHLSSGHSFLKIWPALSALTMGLAVDETGAHDVVTPPGSAPKIEERRINGTDMFIRYKEMTKSDGLLVFRGPYLMLTANLLAVYADVITCTETFYACTATGSVRIETGSGEELEGTQADINLLNHTFKLTRTAIVEQPF